MSVKKCCVPNCNTRKTDKITMHVFPNPRKDIDRFEMWRNAIGGHITALDRDYVFDLRRVCHLHFESRFHTCSNRLCHNAIPTLRLSGPELITPTLRLPVQNETSTELFGSSPSLPSCASDPLHPAVANVGPQELSSSTQRATNVKGRKYNLCPEMLDLGNKIKKLQRAKISLKAKVRKMMNLSENPTFRKTMNKFTAAAVLFMMLQFREAGKTKSGRRFKHDEKILALALYKQGPRAYRWLRKFFVLPSPLTLSRTIRNAGLKPGLNEKLFNQLKKISTKMNSKGKLCILLFDEVALTPHFDYNKRTDVISGFVNTGVKTEKVIADHALVFMIRGIMKNYKQPIMYSFCASTTSKQALVVQIKAVTAKLFEAGFTVVATVCDQGATNVSAINYLVNETRREYIKQNKEYRHNFFEINGKKIIPLFDTPHLMKGIRNNLLTKNLKCNINGEPKTAKWDHIVTLYKENPAYQGIRLLPKLTERHVIPNKIAKMKVKCATQVFSQTVASNLGFLANYGILPKESTETADVLLFFDQLFDSLNGSYVKQKKRGAKLLLGPVTPYSLHKKVWNEAKQVLKTMKFEINNKTTVVPSITNWLKTIENIEELTKVISEKYGVTSLWMRHFNQDPLENFFGNIRSHGYRNTSPTIAGFESAFASLLVNNMSNDHSPGANCEVDTCKVFTSLKSLFSENCETSNSEIEIDFDDVADVCFLDVKEKMTNIKIKAQLEFVTGYVLRKLKQTIFKNCITCNKNFMDERKSSTALKAREYCKNKSYLTYPNINMVECFSNIQDVVIKIIRKDCTKLGIKTYIKTVLAVVLDYNFIKCKQHKKDVIKLLEDVSINLFLFNWCKDCNKILKGIRNDFEDDVIQKMCYEYFKKHCKR